MYVTHSIMDTYTHRFTYTGTNAWPFFTNKHCMQSRPPDYIFCTHQKRKCTLRMYHDSLASQTFSVLQHRLFSICHMRIANLKVISTAEQKGFGLQDLHYSSTILCYTCASQLEYSQPGWPWHQALGPQSGDKATGLEARVITTIGCNTGGMGEGVSYRGLMVKP